SNYRKWRAKMVKQINAVLIDSPQGPQLFEFYRDRLGIPLQEERHGSELHWGCFLNGVHFAIHHKPNLKVSNKPVAISFEVQEVDDFFNRLKTQGVLVEHEPIDRPFGRLAAVRDPDGNVVYLHKYPVR